MGKPTQRFTPEFPGQMVVLYRRGRSINKLAKDFGYTSLSIRQWVKQADRNAGSEDESLSSAEREKLT